MVIGIILSLSQSDPIKRLPLYIVKFKKKIVFVYLNGVRIWLSDQRKDVERDEESVEEVIGQDLVQVVDLQTQDVILKFKVKNVR